MSSVEELRTGRFARIVGGAVRDISETGIPHQCGLDIRAVVTRARDRWTLRILGLTGDLFGSGASAAVIGCRRWCARFGLGGIGAGRRVVSPRRAAAVMVEFREPFDGTLPSSGRWSPVPGPATSTVERDICVRDTRRSYWIGTAGDARGRGFGGVRRVRILSDRWPRVRRYIGIGCRRHISATRAVGAVDRDIFSIDDRHFVLEMDVGRQRTQFGTHPNSLRDDRFDNTAVCDNPLVVPVDDDIFWPRLAVRDRVETVLGQDRVDRDAGQPPAPA
ncbi:hypothetical protein, partial [Nocardia cyriacigeorgica]|uniref:hypothetical protein n=1 Tax=Nocardia cyriacigeorgica TaxID=135487 RepID=UPI002456ADA2